MTVSFGAAASAAESIRVVVPVSIIRVSFLRKSEAASAAMRRFAAALADEPLRKGRLPSGLRRHRPAMHASQQPMRVQIAQVAPHRLARDAELPRDVLDAELAALPGKLQDRFTP